MKKPGKRIVSHSITDLPATFKPPGKEQRKAGKEPGERAWREPVKTATETATERD
jgi:hypothetical protein